MSVVVVFDTVIIDVQPLANCELVDGTWQIELDSLEELMSAFSAIREKFSTATLVLDTFEADKARPEYGWDTVLITVQIDPIREYLNRFDASRPDD